MGIFDKKNNTSNNLKNEIMAEIKKELKNEFIKINEVFTKNIDEKISTSFKEAGTEIEQIITDKFKLADDIQKNNEALNDEKPTPSIDEFNQYSDY